MWEERRVTADSVDDPPTVALEARTGLDPWERAGHVLHVDTP